MAHSVRPRLDAPVDAPVDAPDATALHRQVRHSLEAYFKALEGEMPCNVYRLVVDEIEKTLLEVVMEYTEQNLSKAARILGINRTTLRKKLELHKMI